MNLRDIKKDIEFLIGDFVEDCLLFAMLHPEKDLGQVENLINEASDFADELIEKVNHPAVKTHPDHKLYKKYFPNGGATIFTFEIKGGQEEAFRFIDSLKIFSLLANVADVKSLVIHPATTTHSQLTDAELADQGISRSTIRLSIGTEHIDDLIADLSQAFDAI